MDLIIFYSNMYHFYTLIFKIHEIASYGSHVNKTPKYSLMLNVGFPHVYISYKVKLWRGFWLHGLTQKQHVPLLLPIKDWVFFIYFKMLLVISTIAWFLLAITPFCCGEYEKNPPPPRSVPSVSNLPHVSFSTRTWNSLNTLNDFFLFQQADPHYSWIIINQ